MITHGHARDSGKSPTYHSWREMRRRCGLVRSNCARRNAFQNKNYIGKGITVCERWSNSFQNFLLDMGEKPPGTSLDRINNNAGYSKENCRWATPKEQTRNSSSVRWITTMGKTQVIADWAIELGVHPSAISHRIRKGQSPSMAIEEIYRKKCLSISSSVADNKERLL